ncbi:MAG: hypothetical protein IKR23_13880 [Lachnospiraceae bacterium]|nr:hypothetical protein [Lachnospiraceae bacterium]
MGYNFFKITELKDSFRKKLNTFVATLGSAIGSGTKISFADNDISYVLQLQNERLKNKGLTVDYEIYDRDSRRDAMVGAEWRDAHYESFVCHDYYGVKRKISKAGSKIYSDDKKNILYTTITDVTTGIHPDDETCCCPNCGNVTTIAQIQDGCQYCGTRYKMDDLFPKVTGYFFLNDVALAGNEGKKGIGLSILITYIVSVLIALIARIVSHDPIGIGTFLSLIPLIPLAAFCGYVFFSIFMAIRLIVVGSSQSAGKYGTIGSRKKFEQRMQMITPEFSFEYFTSKAISLIKAAVYSENAQDLLFYRGGVLDPEFKDVIDLNYGGALGLAGVKEGNGIVTVATDAFFDVLYERGSKVKFKRETYRAVFQRRTDIPINMQFSMTKIQCPTCGGSFNAIRNRKCPYCGNPYDIISQDWILVELRRA